MGTGHVLLHYKLLKKLVDTNSEYGKFFEITKSSDFGEDLANCLIESEHMPDGYNGQQEMAIEWDKEKVVGVKFRRETDT